MSKLLSSRFVFAFDLISELFYLSVPFFGLLPIFLSFRLDGLMEFIDPPFIPSSSPPPSLLIVRSQTLLKIKFRLCMQEGTRDIQSAVKFRMGYTLVQREPRSPRDGDPLPNINQYPILNQQEASKTFQATFEKDCGDNDVCESNMVTVANLDLPQGMPHASQPASPPNPF